MACHERAGALHQLIDGVPCVEDRPRSAGGAAPADCRVIARVSWPEDSEREGPRDLLGPRRPARHRAWRTATRTEEIEHVRQVTAPVQ